jgi:hypothetical protein
LGSDNGKVQVNFFEMGSVFAKSGSGVALELILFEIWEWIKNGLK